MRHFKGLCAAVLSLAAAAAFAHEGVKNEAVMARMMAMKSIGAATKVLGQTAKGEVAFDAAAVEAALATLAEQAAATPALFEAEEDDPKSEAKPAIWSDFADFSVKAMALETAAQGAMGQMRSAEDVGGALREIGATCKGCHQSYRE